MSVLAVLGGQYGGEGKGKIMSFLDHYVQPTVIAKGGGPNGGHRVVTEQFDHTFRMLPAHVRTEQLKFIFGAGALIDPTLLRQEMSLFPCAQNVLIDFRSGIIEPRHIEDQIDDKLYRSIGTTYRGTGTAIAERITRRLKLADAVEELEPYLTDTPIFLHERIKRGDDILLEGGQSVYLSNYHGDYPYCTSRDTTIAALCSQVGIGIRYVDRIFLVLKCFPTRNHAGNLPKELPDDEITRLGLSQYNVDGIRRRVGSFDLASMMRGIILNSATDIALTGVDLLDAAVRGKTKKKDLTSKVLSFVESIEDHAKLPVSIISTGPKYQEAVSFL